MPRSPYPPFLAVMRVQSRESRKGFGHSWLVANSSRIPPCGAWAGLARETVHNFVFHFKTKNVLNLFG